MSNQESNANSALNAISAVWAGLLRNARSAKIKVVEDATGEVIWTGEDYNIPKSRSGGSSMMPTPIDIDFSALANNLKNNSRYTVTVETYIDYGEDEDQKNKRNVFSFPIFIDFESPLVSDVQYRSEYDKNTKKTRLYADFYVYDNHYAMGLQLGQITKAAEGSQYMFDMTTFGKYITPVYSSFNSTSKVTIELTDYINDLNKSATIKYSSDGKSYEIVENSNTMIAICYDYALNAATYELTLPSDFLHVDFTQDELTLNPNETKDLTEFLDVYPSSSWLQTLNFTSSDPDVVDVVNQTVIAKTSGSAVVTVIGRDADGKAVLSVTDTGIGIPAEHKDRIFERFYRVDKSHSKASGGTGLGLSIVKHAAAYHTADIQLESEPGQGTTITIQF